MPGAYEKPQLLPLQPSMEPGLPPIFTFHVNPVLSSRLNVELEEKLTVLQVSEHSEGWDDALVQAEGGSRATFSFTLD